MAQSDVEEKNERYFVTRESQENLTTLRKESYAGLRDLTDLQKIEELDIVGPDGTLRGIKNRVRAGRATFENQGALVKRNEEDGKIVVYTTSFKGVRYTYEECRYILTVFHNLRVKVEERDIYIHKFYQRELEERLGVEETMKLPVPQVYINGQHIGGKDELEVLNETGELRHLIANIPRQETAANCRMCGGYEFIPCRKCGGSKNSVANTFAANFRALKCTSCTENGMEPCPVCEERKEAACVEKSAENEAIKREREERELRHKEKIEQEKRERIKKEAIEAEKQAQLERERLQKEKERKKERARLAKERKKRAVEMKQKIVDDIAKELEREKQWQAERDPESKAEEVTEEPKDIPIDSAEVDNLGEEVEDTDMKLCSNNVDIDSLPKDEENELSATAAATTKEELTLECANKALSANAAEEESLDREEIIEFETPSLPAAELDKRDANNDNY